MGLTFIRAIVKKAGDTDGLTATDRQKLISSQKQLGAQKASSVVDIFGDLVVTKEERSRLVQLLKLDAQARKKLDILIGADGKGLVRHHLSSLARSVRWARKPQDRIDACLKINRLARHAKHLLGTLETIVKRERSAAVARHCALAYMRASDPSMSKRSPEMLTYIAGHFLRSHRRKGYAGLRDDPKVMLEAIRLRVRTIKDASRRLKKDVNFLTEAIVLRPSLFHQVSRKYRSAVVKKVLTVALNRGMDLSGILIHLPKKYLNNRALMLPIVTKQPRYLAFIAPQLMVLSKDLALKAYKLNITHPRRFRDEKQLRTIINNRFLAQYYADSYDPRPIAVVISPKNDWNRSFEDMGEYIAEMNEKYRVFYYEVNDEKEFVAAFKDATNGRKASLVIVGGHGSQRSLSLGAPDPAYAKRAEEQFSLDPSDGRDLQGLHQRLVRGAHIVLVSCSVGAGGARAKNLFTFIADVFPNAYIHASTRAGSLSPSFDEKGLFYGTSNGFSGMDTVVMRKNTNEFVKYDPRKKLIHFPHPTHTSGARTELKPAALRLALKDPRPEVRSAAAYEQRQLADQSKRSTHAAKQSNLAFLRQYKLTMTVNYRTTLSPQGPLLKTAINSLDSMSAILKGSDVSAKLKVLDILSEMGPSSKSLLPQLTAMFSERNKEVRFGALRTVASMGPAAAPAVPALVALLNDPKLRIVDQALLALGKVGSVARKYIPRLIAMAKNTHLKLVLRRKAIDALGNMGAASKAAVPVLAKFVKDDDPELSDAALFNLGKIGAPAVSAIPVIARALLTSKDIMVCKIAARALGMLGPQAKAAVPQLIKAIRVYSFSSGIPSAAAWALSKIGKDAVPQMIDAVVRHYSNKQVKGIILLTLNMIGKAALPMLVKTVRQTKREYFFVALSALMVIGAPAIPALFKAYRKSRGIVQMRYSLLFRMMGEDAVRGLIPFLTSHNARERFHAVHILNTLGSKAKPAIPHLARRLGDSDSDVGLYARILLEKLGQDSVPWLIKSLANKSQQAREHAIKALGAIKPLSLKTVKALIEMLKDRNLLVQYAAQMALANAGKNALPLLKAAHKGAHGTFKMRLNLIMRIIR